MRTSLATKDRLISRRRLRRIVYPERRTGFDRRAASQAGPFRLSAYLADRQDVFLKILIAINALSVADFLLTLSLMRLGLVSEGNPVMARLIWLSPKAALGFKISLILAITSVLWRFRRYRLMLQLATLMLIIFTVVVGYQFSLLALAP